jgi:GNAT-family acetyltransferase (TIGR03103 family)
MQALRKIAVSTGRSESEPLDPSSKLVIEEAERRGIAVEVLSAHAEWFRLSYGGRTITCRESLSELTSAVALSRCDDKQVTTRLLRAAGLSTPAQRAAGAATQNQAFLREHGVLVVKPARGEQGRGISVGVQSPEALTRCIERAAAVHTPVLLEQWVEGEDLRVIVIGHKLAAAAVRRPPRVVGNGTDTLRALIEAQSARRQAATAGHSKIPIDEETVRCLRESDYDLASVLPAGKEVVVRRAANLHQGGTIHDVTAEVHPALVDAACRASRALEIPVVGLDMIVPSIHGPAYWILEANERPGLANHEPQPTAARFVDLLFPETKRLSAPES